MNYSIGIVTYHARFEKYFSPLIESLVRIFPDKEIICIANGHPDEQLQIEYLRKFTVFLKQFRNVRYFTHEKSQSLSRCFNHIIINSNNEGCLMLNDDTKITALFREEFEKKIVNKGLKFSIMNETWSNLFITKDIIRKVGWFDENLLGIGQEDVDYMFRMKMLGMEVHNETCLGVTNYVAPSDNPSWKDISTIVDGKYSSTNKEYINRKYLTSQNSPEISKFDYCINEDLCFTLREKNKIKEYPESFLYHEISNGNVGSILTNPKQTHRYLQYVFFKSIHILKRVRRVVPKLLNLS
jgi:hypothetical protein